MKKLNALISSFTFMVVATSTLVASDFDERRANWGKDITNQIPEISVAFEGFEKIPNVAQYKEADWSQAISIARGITVSEAIEIANKNPEITFFFYTKGDQMILEKKDGTYRMFRNGDVVFFSGEPWWGSAVGLADGYVKVTE